MLIHKDETIRNVVRIEEDKRGPSIVLFSGVHGDEVSGIHAVEKVFFDFFTGARTLQQGSLTLVRANEQAIEAERRYVQHNLNRLFKADYGADIDRASYEFCRAQELKTILQNCDYFLDLHSAPTAQEPFIVVEHENAGFFSQLGIPKLMTGWSKFSSDAIGGDAENYANAHGARSATLESGSHFDKRSNDVAYRAVISFLSVLGVVVGTQAPASNPLEIVDVYAVVTKDFDDFRYARQAENFQFVKKGEAFAFQGGRPLTAHEDTYVLIPMKPEETKLREEVCYLGRRVQAS
jgi:succinylglutamate desuccinylase